MISMRYCPFLLMIWPLLCDGRGWVCAAVCTGLPALTASALFIVFSLAGELRSLARHKPRVMRAAGALK